MVLARTAKAGRELLAAAISHVRFSHQAAVQPQLYSAVESVASVPPLRLTHEEAQLCDTLVRDIVPINGEGQASCFLPSGFNLVNF
jgi:hypothetical protein